MNVKGISRQSSNFVVLGRINRLPCRAMRPMNFGNWNQSNTDAVQPVSERNSYALGPPLPGEMPRAPWRPRTAGRIAFFFGPFAGAHIVAISLRRMGHQQTAKKVIFLALGFAVVEATILFFIPETLTGLVGFGAEIAFLLVFPVFMENEFRQWEASHPGAVPSTGWRAIGWGILGSVVFVVVTLLVFAALAALVRNQPA